jgi:hypothetical protein
MKAYREVLHGGELPTSYTRTQSQYPLNYRTGGPIGGLEVLEKRKILRTCRGSNPVSSNPKSLALQIYVVHSCDSEQRPMAGCNQQNS